jgi:hypothetical protein
MAMGHVCMMPRLFMGSALMMLRGFAMVVSRMLMMLSCCCMVLGAFMLRSHSKSPQANEAVLKMNAAREAKFQNHVQHPCLRSLPFSHGDERDAIICR